jgi:predicted nucleic acid-binding protein
MRPPKLLLDASFVAALGDAAHPHHRTAVDHYRTLLAEYVDERIRLVAPAHLLPSPRRDTVFAPVEPLHVAPQHRHAADGVAVPDEDPEFRVTLVLLERYGIHRVASLDPRLERFGYGILPV